jgi:hypothetical protein
MKTGPSKLVVEASDIRRKIDAVTGKVRPSADVVRASIQPLLDSLTKESGVRSERERVFDGHLAKLSGPNRDRQKPPPGELAAIKASRADVLRRMKGMRSAPPKVNLAPPQLRSGSILTFDIPPYVDRWTDGINASANHLKGEWSTFSFGTNSSLAGVCLFFVPVAGRFEVRFAPAVFINYDYWMGTLTSIWNLGGSYSRASSKGFVGAYVSAWDGRQWTTMADGRTPVWDARVSVNDSASDWGGGASWMPQTSFWTLGRPFLFALWAWGGVITSEHDATIGYAAARGTLSASVPWMVIEQKI